MLRWRKMTWAILAFTALMIWWLLSIAQAEDPAVAGFGIILVLLLWLVGFFVLGLVWMMSRPRHRLCPACGHDVKKGLTSCRNCGHSFVPGATAAVS